MNALKMNGHHLAAAPTGIGKTAAALAAALEASSQSPNKKIFFLTGRQSQHKIVIETIREINKSLDFQNIKCVDIIGRQSMCIELDLFSGKCNCEGGVSKGKEMQYIGFSEEILKIQYMLIKLLVKPEAHMPWKALRNSAKDADIIVCDYNHLFIDAIKFTSRIRCKFRRHNHRSR